MSRSITEGRSDYPIRVKHDGTEEIPPYGIMVVTGIQRTAKERMFYKVDCVTIPPQNKGTKIVLVNSSRPIEPSGSKQWGWARHASDGPTWVAYQDDGDIPAFGDMWGVDDQSFKIVYSRPGFEVLGEYDSERGIVFAQFTPDIARYVRLDTDLDDADPDMETGKKTAGFHVLEMDAGSADLTDGQAFTTLGAPVTNRWIDVELDSDKGLWIRWSWYYMEWILVSAECP